MNEGLTLLAQTGVSVECEAEGEAIKARRDVRTMRATSATSAASSRKGSARMLWDTTAKRGQQSQGLRQNYQSTAAIAGESRREKKLVCEVKSTRRNVGGSAVFMYGRQRGCERGQSV